MSLRAHHDSGVRGSYSPSPMHRSRSESNPLNAEVSHVSRQRFDREDSPPVDYQGRMRPMSPGLEERDSARSADMVGRFALGVTRGEAEHQAQGVIQQGGYIFVNADREFRKEDCLAQGKAPLWFSTGMGGEGVGRSVDLTKEAEGKKKPVSDDERQEQLDEKFAFLKFKLGLTKDDVVDYSINGHGIEIYDSNGNLKGRYNLHDLGFNENPANPIRGGGGLKQLLRDRGYAYSDDQIRELSKELLEINREIREIVEPETGKNLAYVFEADNKGNLRGLAPFTPKTSLEADKVLRSDKRFGFYMKTMQRLGLVDTDKRRMRSDKHTINTRGAAAIEDIRNALSLQRIIINNINAKNRDLKAELRRVTPPKPVIPNPAEQAQIDKIKEQIAALKKVKREIGGANPAVLNLMLMQLNARVSYDQPTIRPDGRRVMQQKHATAKDLLKAIPPGLRHAHGVAANDPRGADIVRSQQVDRVASEVASGFETTVREEHSTGVFTKTPLALDPKKPGHREIQQFGTNMGALVHDIAAIPSSDPSSFRKAAFIERRSQSEFAQESRGLELLIAAVVYGGETDIRGFSRESQAVQDVLTTSLAQFRTALPGWPPVPPNQNDAEYAVQKMIHIERSNIAASAA